MEIENYIEIIKKNQFNILSFLNSNESMEENYQNITNFFDDQQIRNNKYEMKLFLRLIVHLSNYHHRSTNFYHKIEMILLYFKDEFHKYFTNSEIFEIFESNKRILLFLIEQKIILFDESIYKSISRIKNYFLYFENEIKSFEKNRNQKGKQENKKENDSDKFSEGLVLFKFNHEEEIDDQKKFLFNEKRKVGENDNEICKLIRNDSVEEFDKYITDNNISLNSKVNESIFETNTILTNKKASLIEYASFFGSIKIFNFLHSHKASLTPSLWIYGVHGCNEEILNILESNNIKPEDETYSKCFEEAIKSHHNDIAYYIGYTFLQVNSDIIIENNKYCHQYYNFMLFENLLINKYVVKLVEYDYYTLVKLLLPSFNVNKKIEMSDSFLKKFDQFRWSKKTVEKPILAFAIEKGNVDIVKLILSSPQIDFNIKLVEKTNWYRINDDAESLKENWIVEKTMLQVAFENKTKNFQLIETLLSTTSININDTITIQMNTNDEIVKTKKTILHLAVEEGNLKILRLLLSHPKINVNSKYLVTENDSTILKNITALQIAVDTENIEICKLLISHPKIDNNFVSKDSKSNETLLSSAVQNKNIEIVKLLLSKFNININAIVEANVIRINKSGRGKNLVKIKRTALCIAIENNDIDITKALLSYPNINVNIASIETSAKFTTEETPLFIAVHNNCIDIAKLLLANPRINVNAKSTMISQKYKIEIPLLYRAVEIKSIDIVKLLLSNPNIFINDTFNKEYEYKNTISKKTAIQLAIEMDQSKIAQVLLSNPNIDVNCKYTVVKNNSINLVNLALLKTAVENSNIEIVKLLLSKPKIDLNFVSTNYQSKMNDEIDSDYDEEKDRTIKETVLGIAVKLHDTKIVKLLLSYQSIDVNIQVIEESKESTSEKTPLFIAIENEYDDIVKLLLSNPNINVNMKSSEIRILASYKAQKTPLYKAVENKSTEIVKLLLSNPNIDVNDLSIESTIKMTLKQTALYYAVEKKLTSIIALLLSNTNTNPNIKSEEILPDSTLKSEKTPLFKAIQDRSLLIIEFLVKYPSIDVNVKSLETKNSSCGIMRCEKTPLYLAVENIQQEIIQTLLKNRKIDVNLLSCKTINIDGENFIKTDSPLHIAALSEKLDIINLLLKNKKIDVNVKDEHGKTPIELVSNKKVISLLKQKIE